MSQTSPNNITLLSGSQINLHTTHTALLPEVVEFEAGAFITLLNDKQEFLGTAEVTDVKIKTFALVQNKELEETSHEGTTGWANALHTLSTQIAGFSQLDKVSLITFYVNAIAGAGLTIAPAEPAEPVEEETAVEVPSIEDQYAGLSTVGDIANEEEVDGNHE